MPHDKLRQEIKQIRQESERITQRLDALSAERNQLLSELADLQATDRVLGRLATHPSKRHRDRRLRAEPADLPGAPPKTGVEPSVPLGTAHQTPSISDAVLQVVQAHPAGITALDVNRHLADKFHLKVRPNHLGVALSRHRQAERLTTRDDLWFPPAA